MQVTAINRLGAEMYLHVTQITNPLLVERYGEYSINFFEFPNSNQAPKEVVIKAVEKLFNDDSYKDWNFIYNL
jgi:hypothetical protein